MVRLKSGTSSCLWKNPKINDSQSWTILPPGNIWQCVETFWVVITWGDRRGMTDIKWEKAGEAAEQPAMHRPVLHDKGLSSPKVRAAGPETPCLRGNGTPPPPGAGLLRGGQRCPWHCVLSSLETDEIQGLVHQWAFPTSSNFCLSLGRWETGLETRKSLYTEFRLYCMIINVSK